MPCRASALAADCRAFLGGQRVAARPLSRVERAGDLLGRHRKKAMLSAMAVAAAAGAVFALVIERMLGR